MVTNSQFNGVSREYFNKSLDRNARVDIGERFIYQYRFFYTSMNITSLVGGTVGIFVKVFNYKPPTFSSSLGLFLLFTVFQMYLKGKG